MFFITCFSKCEKNEKGFFNGGSRRTFGYRETLEAAEESLNKNICDMHEFLYGKFGLCGIMKKKVFSELKNRKPHMGLVILHLDNIKKLNGSLLFVLSI